MKLNGNETQCINYFHCALHDSPESLSQHILFTVRDMIFIQCKYKMTTNEP